MNDQETLVPLPGSERTPVPEARAVGPSAQDERLEVTVRVRHRASLQPHAISAAMADRPVRERHYLTRQQYSEEHGADPQDLAAVEAFAQDHGLTVVASSPARRSVILSGTVENLNAAFGVFLQQYQTPDGGYRGREGTIKVPAALQDIVEGVFGLDDRPQATPHFMIRKPLPGLQPHVVT